MTTAQLDREILPSVGKNIPSLKWTEDQLGQFAKRCEDKCLQAGKTMAVHRYREGHALHIAEEKVPSRQWGQFLKSHGISTSSDARARLLYKRVKSEEELKDVTIMDAYVVKGIEKRRHTTSRSVEQETLHESLEPHRAEADRDGGSDNMTGLCDFLTVTLKGLTTFGHTLQATRDEEVLGKIESLIDKLYEMKSAMA